MTTEQTQPIIGQEELARARQTLRKYKTGKANLERRIVENEQWWKLRHWQQLRPQRGGADDPKPASGWLVNVCLNKHADAMDAFPTCLCLPREPADRELARTLSDVLPVVLEQNDYERVYSDCWWYKLKHGASCKGVFWDGTLLDGLGDVAIRRIDLLNLFWEPGITELQRSRNVFCVELRDNDLLEAEWPQLTGKLGGEGLTLTRYLYDDAVDTSGKSVVVDWYYKKRQGGRTALHYCKFVGDTLLYSSENAGLDCWYSHGRYPFVLDVLFPEEGTPAGFGCIDLCRDAQEQIDLMNNAILKNTMAAASPRWFIRNDGAISEEEYLDFTRPFVHTNATLAQDSILPVAVSPLSDVYLACLNGKITELKEVSGNRDTQSGGAPAGVTAASAIAAVQEQAGKLSRDQIAGSYRAFREECLLAIELMRQFYDAPRCFRITGRSGEEFVRFSNRGLAPQPQGSAFGVALGARTPLFDLRITAQKQSGYSRAAANELGLQLYRYGLFDPARSEQALQCLELMDFDGREEVMRRVAEAGTRQRLAALAARSAAMGTAASATGSAASATGTAASVGNGRSSRSASGNGTPGTADAAAAAGNGASGNGAAGSGAAGNGASGNGAASGTDTLSDPRRDGTLRAREHPFVERARRAARESILPR